MTAPITTEKLSKLVSEATSGPWGAKECTDDDSWHIHGPDKQWIASVHIDGAPTASRAESTLIALAPTLAAELITARAKLEAVEKLAELCRLVHGSFGGGLLMTFSEQDVADFSEALASWRAAQ